MFIELVTGGGALIALLVHPMLAQDPGPGLIHILLCRLPQENLNQENFKKQNIEKISNFVKKLSNFHLKYIKILYKQVKQVEQVKQVFQTS